MKPFPQVLGPYRLLEPLGRGGMGVVWRAEHAATGQVVALKTVRVPRQESLQGLRREIHALASLRHPGVVRILEEGLEDGLPWYAMELLEGTRLGHACAALGGGTATVGQATESSDAGWWTRSLTELDGDASRAAPFRAGSQAAAGAARTAVLTLVRRLCVPLAYMHGEGMVHRDLKPDNVLVRPDGWPVLVDFGLVTQFDAELSREALEPATGAAGTAAYMAPEQITGELVDARTDLYALGCILHELLTGRPPFAAEGVAQMVRAHLTANPPAPSELVPDLPPALDALILKLLSKQPRERFGHAEDVSRALAEAGAEDGAWPGAPPPRAYLYRPGFVGRAAPLSELAEHLERLAGGRGAVVLVGGESGMGKTRLLLELAREARRKKLLVLSGEALPGAGAAPLGPLRRPLETIADRCRERGLEETERLLGRRRSLLAQHAPLLRELPDLQSHPEPAELPAEAARRRLYSALADTFEALAADTPVLLLLDDLQWADELTLGWLQMLLRRRLRSNALLVLGAYRTEEPGAGLERLMDSEAVQRIGLSRLEASAVGDIVGAMLSLSAAPAPFVRYLAEQSEGNPFFVAEYLRTAVAEGLLCRRDGRWDLAQEGGAATQQAYQGLPLPGSLRELIGRRLEGLSVSALRLVEAGAVLGRESDDALLAEVAGLNDETGRLDGIRELLTRQVLEELEPGRLRFVHDKIREVAYQGTAGERRQQLHRAAAEAMERQPQPKSGAQMGVLAHHWEQAQELNRARACYLAAARYAKDRHASHDAEGLYRAYLRLSTEPTPEGVDARNEFGGEVLRVQGRMDEALAEHCSALEEARQIGHRSGEGASFRLLGTICLERSRMEESRELYGQALSVAREGGDRCEEGNVLSDLGFLNMRQGRMEEARQLFEQALALAREVGDRRGEGNVLSNLGVSCLQLGRVEEARALCARSLEIHRETGNRRFEGIVLSNLAMVHAVEGRREEELQLLEQALGVHREVGNRLVEGIVLGNLANLHRDQGRIEKARELYEETLRIHREVGNPRNEGIVLADLAGLLRLATDELGRAEALAREGEAILAGLGDKLERAKLLCIRGHIALAGGESAGEMMRRAESIAGELAAGSESELARMIARLRRAQANFEAGRPLLRGECPEDFPEALRRRLAETS